MRLDELLDVFFEKFVRHPEPASRIEHLLREEEAIRAIEITRRTCWFRKNMECWRGVFDFRYRFHELNHLVQLMGFTFTPLTTSTEDPQNPQEEIQEIQVERKSAKDA